MIRLNSSSDARTIRNSSIEKARSKRDRERRIRVFDYIDANLHRSISLGELAQIAYMSQFHFSRRFRLVTGVTPMQYLALRRIEKAQEMLRETELPIADVAAACGYCSQSHMCTSFKEMTGNTPLRYRNGVLGFCWAVLAKCAHAAVDLPFL